MPEGAIYVGRPSKFGNPFRPVQQPSGLWISTDDNGITYDSFGPFYTRAAALRDCVRLFDEVEIDLGLLADRAEITELRGHDLVCWCSLDQPCHADVLLRVANS